MTIKELFEGSLIESRKELSPMVLLREFNHYANQAIESVVNDYYIAFETNQKVLDYLKALKTNLQIAATSITPTAAYRDALRFDLPTNYRHLTGLLICYEVVGAVTESCLAVGEIFEHGSKRIDSDRYVSIIQDPYQKPRYFNPYHILQGTEAILLTGNHPGINVKSVTLDYLKRPATVALTQNQAFTDTVDVSENLEFDEITNQKILDKLIQFLMERSSDPRLATFPASSNLQPQVDVLQNRQ